MKKRVFIIVSLALCALMAFALFGCSNREGTYSSKDIEFTVSADKTEIIGTTEQVTVSVKAQAKRTINNVYVGTSSYKEKGAVNIECYMVADGKEYVLYDDQFHILNNAMVYCFSLSKGQSVERELKFSRLPYDYKDYEKYGRNYEVMPEGEYHVRVMFNGDGSWTETDIVINAR